MVTHHLAFWDISHSEQGPNLNHESEQTQVAFFFFFLIQLGVSCCVLAFGLLFNKIGFCASL